MKRWVALLRGVNVGGTGKLPMKEFRALLEELGFERVATYIQSGNAVFDANGKAATIARAITNAVEDRFGFRRPVIVITPDDLEAALAANPYPEAESDPNKLHLFFLEGSPTLDTDGLRKLCANKEQFTLSGNVFYFYTPGGFGASSASAKIDRFLKADIATARNLKSCLAILDLARSLGLR